MLIRAISDGLVDDGITIKLARVGGLTRAKLFARHRPYPKNLKVTIEDTGGAQIDTAAYSGLLLSTPRASQAAHGRLSTTG
jgi:L-alanine-DL-glutamate epimerase-like enolase superfamily enzyme